MWRRLGDSRLPLLACLAAAVIATSAEAATTSSSGVVSELQTPAPIDYGYGLNVKPPAQSSGVLQRLLSTASQPVVTAGAVPNGGTSGATIGFFGTPIPWPIVMVHLVLLPDGRVLNYGTDESGNQGGKLLYDVWNPSLGTALSAHLVLPNTTSTDIFCSGQTVLGNGKVLLTGGDLTVGGVRNYSNNKTTIFTPSTDTVANGTAMAYPRWYSAIVPLPNGNRLVVGGRSDPATGDITPEVYSPTSGWSVLSGISTPGFNTNEQWFYPRAFLGPDGFVYILEFDNSVYKVSTSGTGSVSTVAPAPLINLADRSLPAAMFAPGKILAIRAQYASSGLVNDFTAEVVNLNGATPVSTATAAPIQGREWSSLTVLADGTVLLDGGSFVFNALPANTPANTIPPNTGFMGYNAEIWNPSTGQWTVGPAATKPRMYHSNALLLPDGTVLTGGTGAPSPVLEMNGEIFYPPYLYTNDGSGNPAPRPSIVAAPPVATAGKTLAVVLGSTGTISRVTFVRAGSATHSFNTEQRFLDLSTSSAQNGTNLAVKLPTSPDLLVPGNWLLFVFNAAGVPSVAAIINVLPSTL